MATGTLDFIVDSTGSCKGLATLGSGSTCNLALDFQPQQIGARSDNVTITDDVLNTPGSLQLIALGGMGLQVPTATSLVIDTADTIPFGTPVKLTATVTPYSSGAVVAGGTIQFFDGGASLGPPVTISSTGESSITISTFAVAATPHNLEAVYSGDTNFKTSTSPVLELTVHAAPIAVSLRSSDNPSEYGQTVTFTATVPTPATGTIQFVDGGVNLGSPVAINGSGIATISLSSLTVGMHPITAVYSGDGSHAEANSDVLNQHVIPAFLTVTANNITRSYDTANGTPDYTVTGFIGTDTEQNSVSGIPAFSITATAASPVGNYPITVAMGTLASSSYSFRFVNGTLNVTKVTPGVSGVTGISLASSINPSTWGENVTLTATLPPNATGQVTFIDGTTVLGTAIIIDEKALFPTALLSIATHPITAVYAGDTNYNGATSAVLNQVVNKATLNVVANDKVRAFGQPNPVFTTTIGGFVNGDTSAVVSGMPQVTTAATATSPVGMYPILSAQGTLAATNYNFVFINGNLQVVQIAATETLTASQTTIPSGTPVSFMATVSMGATGTVTFFDGSTVLGTVPVNGNTALLITSTLSVGSHSIQAIYSGDTNFTTASSTLSVSVVVTADFSVASNTPRQLIPPGASATYNIIISSVDARSRMSWC